MGAAIDQLQEKIKNAIIANVETHGVDDLPGSVILIPRTLLQSLGIEAKSDQDIVIAIPNGRTLSFKWELYEGSEVLVF